MRKGSRVTIDKPGSGFHGMAGTIRLVDRGLRKAAKADGFEPSLWYLVDLDELKTEPDLTEDTFILTDDKGCVWFREKEVVPLQRQTARE